MKLNMKRFSSVTKAARIAVLALPWLVTAAMAEPAAEGAAVAASTGDYANVAKYIAVALTMMFGSLAASLAVPAGSLSRPSARSARRPWAPRRRSRKCCRRPSSTSVLAKVSPCSAS